VVLTIMRGDAVVAALSDVKIGKTWDVFEKGIKKYSIKRMFTSGKIELAGQKIGVLLPFSAGEYYEEFLTNEAALTAEFAARGFELTVNANIVDSLPDFEARNQSITSRLTDGDRKWLSLYGEVVYKRKSIM